MLDHITLQVGDLARSRAFYLAVLKPLGSRIVHEVTAEQSGGAAYLGFGPGEKPIFWIGNAPRTSGPAHVAFVAASRAQVDAFHAAAMASGGRDNGAPGLRAHYHPTYYGAFVLDPDGNNIEAVCHATA